MKAIKGNKAYNITTTEEEKAYMAQGFDIYDDDGKIKQHGIGKTVPLEKYEALEKENAALKKKNKALEKSNGADKE